MVKLSDLRLKDESAEQVRRSHAEAIKSMSTAPGVVARIVQGVQLKNGVATTVGHPLGRVPQIVKCGIPRGAVSAGFISDDPKVDRTKSVKLTATGYGATITVDLEFA